MPDFFGPWQRNASEPNLQRLFCEFEGQASDSR
jgi:hypothetical protein